MVPEDKQFASAPPYTELVKQNEDIQALNRAINNIVDLRNCTSEEVPECVYVIEECSELIKELMKAQRHKSDSEQIFDEACDVLTTVLVLLRSMNRRNDDICRRIIYKCDRAIDRWYKKGEL